MNFLQLCQRLRSEAGIAGSGPLTVVNQNEELGRLVNWIKDAYVDIQDKRNDWAFLREDFTISATSGQAEYTLANLAQWKTKSMRLYATALGAVDEQYLMVEDWERFRDVRLFGSSRDDTGRSIYAAIKPDKTLVLWPIPDANYTVVGEYFTVTDEFTNDIDEPVFSRHHMAIVYNALMRYAAYVADPSLYSRAEIEYKRLSGKLERDFAPTMKLGAALL